jgi:Calx-beta domain
VTRTGGSAGIVGATVNLANGTAIAPNDYNNSSIALNFTDGDTAPKTVTIPIVSDSLLEGNETINLSLNNLTGGATLGTQNTATLTIIDDDTSSQNLVLSRATYLGGTGNDEASAAAISPSGEIVVAGNLNGTARLQRFNSTPGSAPLSDTNLGTDVNDMDVDRATGKIVTVGNFGIKVFNSDGTTPVWSQPGIFDKVAIANDGKVATLTNSSDTVTLWSAAGTQLATTTLTGTDIRPADLAINPTGGQVYVTGFNQVASNLQTPFLRAFDPSLNQIWNTWDYSNSQVTGQNLGADSRGVAVTFGEDGGLYFLGKTDGGNNVFTRDGEDITQSLGSRRIQQDAFNSFAGAGAGSFTFFAKINVADGTVDRGQFVVTQRSNPPVNSANSFSPSAIGADAAGNVYIGGGAAFQLKDRNLQQINGQPVGNYSLGEMAVMSVTPDFQTRRFWTPLTATGDADGAKGNVNSLAVGNGKVAIFGTVTQPNAATIASDINPNPLGGNDAYLAIL